MISAKTAMIIEPRSPRLSVAGYRRSSAAFCGFFLRLFADMVQRTYREASLSVVVFDCQSENVVCSLGRAEDMSV